MSAGKMRSRIVIERKAQVADGMGGHTETWSADPAGGIWAMWAGLGGGERWQAMRISPNSRYRVVIRFRGDANGAPYYSAADRVKYKGREYSIESAMDMEDRGQWLELMLAEGAPS